MTVTREQREYTAAGRHKGFGSEDKKGAHPAEGVDVVLGPRVAGTSLADIARASRIFRRQGCCCYSSKGPAAGRCLDEHVIV